MSFTQEKIDRATIQSRGIFNSYVYKTTDTVEQVQAPGYFAACRFAILDGPATNSNGWNGGVVECHCSDGYLMGIMDGATGTMSGAFVTPTVISQADFLDSDSVVNQIPGVLGTPLQISFGPAQSTPQFDLAADGTMTCNITGQYRFIFTAQAGRVGGAGVVNLFLRLLLNGTRAGSSVLARLDNAATVIPQRFNLTIDLEAGDFLTAQVLQDTSGVAGGGGLYALTPEASGWAVSPSASLTISQLSLVV
jgi:hypothetical protein